MPLYCLPLWNRTPKLSDSQANTTDEQTIETKTKLIVIGSEILMPKQSLLVTNQVQSLDSYFDLFLTVIYHKILYQLRASNDQIISL